MTSYFDLSNKVALVTGASSGIGAATAKLFAELGADVAIGFHRNQSGAEEVREEIERFGRKTIVIGADMRDSGQIEAMVKRATEALGAIDVLVNNAGSLIERVPTLEMS